MWSKKKKVAKNIFCGTILTKLTEWSTGHLWLSLSLSNRLRHLDLCVKSVSSRSPLDFQSVTMDNVLTFINRLVATDNELQLLFKRTKIERPKYYCHPRNRGEGEVLLGGKKQAKWSNHCINPLVYGVLASPCLRTGNLLLIERYRLKFRERFDKLILNHRCLADHSQFR